MRWAAAILIAISCPAHAAPATLGGAGLSCADWTRDRPRDVAHAGELLWVLGYVSGAAVATGRDFLAGVDIRLIDAAVSVHCANNPADRLPDAARSVLQGLMQ